MSETSNVHKAKVAVRWSDFDRFGHITNAAYVELAQEARLVFANDEFRDRGYEIPAVFVRKLEAEYLRPVLPNTTEVIVESQVTEIGTTSFTTRQEVKDFDGNVCCVITVVQVAVNPMTARPRDIEAFEKKVLTKNSSIPQE